MHRNRTTATRTVRFVVGIVAVLILELSCHNVHASSTTTNYHDGDHVHTLRGTREGDDHRRAAPTPSVVSIQSLMDLETFGTSVVAPVFVVPSQRNGRLTTCAMCNEGKCEHAYRGYPGRFCGSWDDELNEVPVRAVACCPANYGCVVDEGDDYVACALRLDMHAIHLVNEVMNPVTTSSSKLIGGAAWKALWGFGAFVAAAIVATVWRCSHPPSRNGDDALPPLPQRDAIISFPLHRSAAYTTRVVFTTVVAMVVLAQVLFSLALIPPGMYDKRGRGITLGLALLWLWWDWDAAYTRRIVVSDACLEVNRRFRSPIVIRLSQVISVKQRSVQESPLLLLKALFHYSTSYSRVVEVTYARDGCGACTLGCAPRGVGCILLSPQHASTFITLVRERSRRCKHRASAAAATAMKRCGGDGDGDGGGDGGDGAASLSDTGSDVMSSVPACAPADVMGQPTEYSTRRSRRPRSRRHRHRRTRRGGHGTPRYAVLDDDNSYTDDSSSSDDHRRHRRRRSTGSHHRRLSGTSVGSHHRRLSATSVASHDVELAPLVRQGNPPAPSAPPQQSDRRKAEH